MALALALYPVSEQLMEIADTRTSCRRNHLAELKLRSGLVIHKLEE